jgi:SAM-dependent methyltransferase
VSALDSLIRDLKPGAEALDYGCFGWSLHARAQALGRPDLRHSGADTVRPANIPPGAAFFESKGLTIDCDSDRFDLVVASHILEHVTEPLKLFAELARVCRPGGKIYIETPSDRALRPFSSADPEDHACLSFWDDPTHVRPWTPAGLYRLAVSFGCRPLACAYMTEPFAKLLYPLRRLTAWLAKDGDLATQATWSAYGWCCHAVIEKPQDLAGQPEYRYISLKGVPPGADNALKLYRELKGG